MSLIVAPNTGNGRPCCADRRNRAQPVWKDGQQGLTSVEVCLKCGARHHLSQLASIRTGTSGPRPR